MSEETETELQEASSSIAPVTPTTAAAKKPIAIIAVAVIAIIAAIIGFALYATNLQPSGAAAKVDDVVIKESDVETYVAQYRASYNLTDDTAWAYQLLSDDTNPSEFRQKAIYQLIENEVINRAAKEHGCAPTDEELDDQIALLKANWAFNDDTTWNNLLSQSGMTEQTLRTQYYSNMCAQKLYAQEVTVTSADNEKTLAYAKYYLAGVEVKHAYHIVCSSIDDANAVYNQITSSGSIDTNTFVAFATAYSKDSNVSDDNGSLGWINMTSQESDYCSVLSGLSAGQVSSPFLLDDTTNEYEIVYCDTDYTFPSSSDISTLTLSSLPSTLPDYVRDLATEALWSLACSTYVDNLMDAASITIYPMPASTSYNVDMNKAMSYSASSTSTSNTSK